MFRTLAFVAVLSTAALAAPRTPSEPSRPSGQRDLLGSVNDNLLQAELRAWKEAGKPDFVHFPGNNGQPVQASIVRNNGSHLLHGWSWNFFPSTNDIKFHLYTKSDESDIYGQVVELNSASLLDAGFNSKLPTKVLIHGFANNIESDSIQNVKNGGIPIAVRPSCAARPARRYLTVPVPELTTMVDFLSLPDDALLAVLAHLTPLELFACRPVCRRLRDICLHPDLWKKVQVVDTEKGLLRAALALAPCLGRIIQTLPVKVLASLLPGSTCIVDSLCLRLNTKRDVSLATDVLLHLSSVGGVRTFYVDWGVYPPPVKTITKLAKILFNLQGLEDLDFYYPCIKSLPNTLRDLQVQVTPTLKILHYSNEVEVDVKVDPFAELLLKTHAATLQKVNIYLKEVPVSLLVRLPRLQSLACFSHDDLPNLLHLENLDTFKLLYDLAQGPEEKEVFSPGTLKFLRQASHLKSITLPWFSSSALLALSTSLSARVVETLKLDCLPGFDLKELIDVLAQLPCLRTLDLNAEPSDDLLRAISPASLPCLTALAVLPPEDTCLDAWLHEPATHDLLVRNPGLHLFAHQRSRSVGACCCVWCQWGCRSILREGNYLRQPVSSHKRKAGCNCLQVPLSSCPS